MNEYMINTGFSRVSVTAANEKDARRIYRENTTAEEKHFKDIAVELIRENVPATKQQEREALEKIKAIVATLGPRSYVGTALDGCLEDAEVNIENDFGDSMKARWEAAEKRVAQAVKETAEAKEELAQVRRELQTAEDDVNFYRDKVLDSDDLTDLAQLVDSYISGLRDKVKAAEAAILEYAEHPETTTFVDAVRGRKNLAKAIEYYQALAQRIKHAQGQ